MTIRALTYPVIVATSFLLLFAMQATLTFEFKVLSTVSLTIMTVIIAVLERFRPYRKDWNMSKGDLASDFLQTVVVFPIIVFICQTIVEKSPGSIKIFDLTSAPLFLQFLFGLLSAEFLFYWLHRWFHEKPLFWRLHVWHHSVRRVYWMNAGNFNPLDLFLNFLTYCLPFAIIGMDPRAFEYVLFFSAATGVMEHCNIDFSAGRLNYLFNTAELHRWHHSIIPKESMTNYGKALSVFDVLFRTFKYSTTEQVKEVGAE